MKCCKHKKHHVVPMLRHGGGIIMTVAAALPRDRTSWKPKLHCRSSASYSNRLKTTPPPPPPPNSPPKHQLGGHAPFQTPSPQIHFQLRKQPSGVAEWPSTPSEDLQVSRGDCFLFPVRTREIWNKVLQFAGFFFLLLSLYLFIFYFFEKNPP